MGETVKYAKIQRPAERDGVGNIEKEVEYGVRTPSASSFDRRPAMGSGPTYIGPSKVEKRAKGLNPANTQQKKHVSPGRGQS